MFSTKKTIIVGAHGLAVMSSQCELFQFQLVSAAKPKVMSGAVGTSDDPYVPKPYPLKDMSYTKHVFDHDVTTTWHWAVVNRDCLDLKDEDMNKKKCHKESNVKEVTLPNNKIIECKLPSYEKACTHSDEACWTQRMNECLMIEVLPALRDIPSASEYGGTVDAAVLSCENTADGKDENNRCTITVKLYSGYQGTVLPADDSECVYTEGNPADNAWNWLGECSSRAGPDAPGVAPNTVLSYTFIQEDAHFW